MRKLLLPFAFLMGLSVFAQDLIIKKDQTEVKAKVIELTDELIKYKKQELLDGPIYSIKNSEVFMIVYKNGTKEYISQKISSTVVPVQETTEGNFSNQIQSAVNQVYLKPSNQGVQSKSTNSIDSNRTYKSGFYASYFINSPSGVISYSMSSDFRIFDSFCAGVGFSNTIIDTEYVSDSYFGLNLIANYKIALGDSFHIYPGLGYTYTEFGSSTGWLVGANWYFYKYKTGRNKGALLGLNATVYDANSTSLGLVLKW
jgi:hypothetical protein